MIIDFIATRDIQPDEEIFIDYGTFTYRNSRYPSPSH